jgi:hypothetical protein
MTIGCDAIIIGPQIIHDFVAFGGRFNNDKIGSGYGAVFFHGGRGSLFIKIFGWHCMLL